MKTLLIVTGFIFILFGLFLHRNEIVKYLPVKKEFHLKVNNKSFYGDRYFVILFTNNNWLTTEVINRTFDITDVMKGERVCYQQATFKTLEEALELSKIFSNYEKCLEYNEVQLQEAKRLRKYWEDHPELIPKDKPVEETKVETKEIIIH